MKTKPIHLTAVPSSLSPAQVSERLWKATQILQGIQNRLDAQKEAKQAAESESHAEPPPGELPT